MAQKGSWLSRPQAGSRGPPSPNPARLLQRAALSIVGPACTAETLASSHLAWPLPGPYPDVMLSNPDRGWAHGVRERGNPPKVGDPGLIPGPAAVRCVAFGKSLPKETSASAVTSGTGVPMGYGKERDHEQLQIHYPRQLGQFPGQPPPLIWSFPYTHLADEQNRVQRGQSQEPRQEGSGASIFCPHALVAGLTSCF